MLYVQEKVVKLGGIYLEGQVTSVEVQEAGSVYVAQDEKGRYKKSQPVGYENGKVMIDILLEATKSASTLEQLTEMQRLFKPYGQSKPNHRGYRCRKPGGWWPMRCVELQIPMLVRLKQARV